MRVLLPQGWPRPKGYADGVVARGETIFLAGQIGWDAEHRLARGLAAQVEQALRNIMTLLAEAGAGPQHLTRMTWYLVDLADYAASLGAIGDAYRRVIGKQFPAMSVVQVARLLEPEALVEIEATAVLPDDAPRR